MTSPQHHHLAADHSTVSIQDGGQTLSGGFLVDRLFTLLKAHLSVLKLLFDFSRREQDIIKLLSLPALDGTMIIKTTWSKPAKT